MTEEEERDHHNKKKTENNNKKSEFVIKIPSYEQVINGVVGVSSSNSSSSLFKPSSQQQQSFSQAFSSLKNTDFYSPPPPPHLSRQLGEAETVASSSSSYGFGENRNAILVSNRQEGSTSGTTPLFLVFLFVMSFGVVLMFFLQKRDTKAEEDVSNASVSFYSSMKGNPLLKHIRNVKWVFADIVCDYLLGQSTCALYLSLRYHLLHPDYLYFRIRELQKTFKLRVVLCHVDVEDVVKPLLEVTKTSMLHDCTLLCAWSLEECGRYLETIKLYENKPADIIQGQTDTDYLSRLTHALTSIRHVNKTDVVTLGSTFGSLSHVMDASMEDLARCPGIGEKKVKRLYDTFHEPFKRVITKNTSVPETSTQNNPKLFHVNEEKSEVRGDKSKVSNIVPEVTVKSALLTAFSKYSHKIGPKKHLQQEKIEGTSSSAEGKGKNESCEKEKAS